MFSYFFLFHQVGPMVLVIFRSKLVNALTPRLLAPAEENHFRMLCKYVPCKKFNFKNVCLTLLFKTCMSENTSVADLFTLE